MCDERDGIGEACGRWPVDIGFGGGRSLHDNWHFSMALWEFIIGVVKGLFKIEGDTEGRGCGSICVQLYGASFLLDGSRSAWRAWRKVSAPPMGDCAREKQRSRWSQGIRHCILSWA